MASQQKEFIENMVVFGTGREAHRGREGEIEGALPDPGGLQQKRAAEHEPEKGGFGDTGREAWV